MLARRSFTEIQQAPIQLDDFSITARRVNHPQGCLSFRIENNGKVLHYATDNEPGDPLSDRAILELAQGADTLIFDCQYTWDQIRGRNKGWGHNTWEEGVRICQEAGVRRLILFHHDPDRSDAAIDELQACAQARFPQTLAAFEGMELTL
jgi:ribonuclease BN (tRNA processing enzyme)